MESAHLTKAHEHVRNAQTATLSSSIATAGDEHHHAAALFHDAAQDTHNDEALRILSLLEDHHRKLAGLIKEAPPKSDKKTSTSSSTTTTNTNTTTASSLPTSASAPRTHRRLPQSSIASNLAEKRGIPSARRTTSGTAVTVSGANAARDGQATPVRDLLERQARKADQSRSRELTRPPKDAATPHPQPQPQPSSPPPEDNFRRFYSAFGGVISAISAPLAFTSLPLNPTPAAAATPPPEPARTEKTPHPKSRNSSPEASRTVKSSVPDLAALISKPALRALRSDSANPLNPNESFYLVPTSGGTLTYASMLQGPTTTPLAAIDEDPSSLKGSHDEFVDAQETVPPPSPTSTRRPRSHSHTSPSAAVQTQRSIPAGRGTALKTPEELALENETLKSLVDTQAKRIQMWETNSQNQFNALAQSFRARPLRNTTDPAIFPADTTKITTTSTSTTAPDGEEHHHRLAALQAQIAAQTLRLEELTSSNALLARQSERDKIVIQRYREQWEKLKAGARKKEMERRGRKNKEGREQGGGEEGDGEAEGEGLQNEAEEEGAVEGDFGRA